MRAFWLAIPLLCAIAIACSGDDAATATPEPTPTPVFVDDLCPLLPGADVLRTTGYELLEAQPHNAAPFHFCTFYLDIPDCDMTCALSLEYLGPEDANNLNSPDAFREALKGANPDDSFTFRDDVFGPKSWLATAQGGQIPNWKVTYFQVNDVAYNLHGPLVAAHALTEQQVIDVTSAVIARLKTVATPS